MFKLEEYGRLPLKISVMCYIIRTLRRLDNDNKEGLSVSDTSINYVNVFPRPIRVIIIIKRVYLPK